MHSIITLLNSLCYSIHIIFDIFQWDINENSLTNLQQLQKILINVKNCAQMFQDKSVSKLSQIFLITFFRPNYPINKDNMTILFWVLFCNNCLSCLVVEFIDKADTSNRYKWEFGYASQAIKEQPLNTKMFLCSCHRHWYSTSRLQTSVSRLPNRWKWTNYLNVSIQFVL